MEKFSEHVVMDILDGMQDAVRWAKATKARWESLRDHAIQRGRKADIDLAESMIASMNSMIAANESMIKTRKDWLEQRTPRPIREEDKKKVI
jgi:hypothetical protein